MKNIILLSAILFYSQVLFAQDFGAELLLGANFSQVDGDQLGGYNKLGANIGIQINREVKEDWDLAFELRYSMKGAKKVQDQDNPLPTLKLSYDYLEVPLLIKYQGFEKITPYSGLSVGVNVINERDDNGFIGEETNLDFMEYGFHLGCTYHVTEKLGLDLRHTFSLLSIRNSPSLTNGPRLFGRNGWYNRLFTIGIIYDLER